MGNDRRVKILAWSNDSFLSRHGQILPWDKLEHVIRETVLTFIVFGFIRPFLINFFPDASPILQWLLSGFTVVSGIFVFGFLWEVRDGIRAYNGLREIEGFSIKDLFANVAGIFVGLVAYGVTWGQI